MLERNTKGMQKKSTKIIAHRGNSSEAPENSLIAFQQALDLGADFLEGDIQLTKDGYPILLHDPSLKKITKNQITEDINDLFYDEIKDIDIGSWVDDKFYKEKIITLEDFLSFSKFNVGVMLDIKEETFKKEQDIQRICILIQQFQKKNENSKILIGSLNYEIMKVLQKFFHPYELISIVEYEKDLINFYNINSQYYALNYDIIDQETLYFLKKGKKEIWSWVIDEVDIALNAIKQGINGIITNYPKKMILL